MKTFTVLGIIAILMFACREKEKGIVGVWERSMQSSPTDGEGPKISCKILSDSTFTINSSRAMTDPNNSKLKVWPTFHGTWEIKGADTLDMRIDGFYPYENTYKILKLDSDSLCLASTTTGNINRYSRKY
jgi:hypothetical protein